MDGTCFSVGTVTWEGFLKEVSEEIRGECC